MQLWVKDDFRALLHVVAARKRKSLSGYVRQAVWERLQNDAEPRELKEYKASAWGRR